MATYTLSNYELHAYNQGRNWLFRGETDLTPIPSPRSLSTGDKIVFANASLDVDSAQYLGTEGSLGFSVSSQEGGEGSYDIKLRCTPVTFTSNWANETSFTVVSVTQGEMDWTVILTQDSDEPGPGPTPGGEVKVMGENAVAFVKEKVEDEIEENLGKTRVLSSTDYNYPTNNPDGVAMWLLDPGTYKTPNGLKIYYNSTVNITTSGQDVFVHSGSSGLHIANWVSGNGKPCKYLTSQSGGGEKALALEADLPTVVQTTGTSTTSVMSQKAVTDAIGDIEQALHTLNNGEES